jgi:hypothetical protein
MNKHINIEEAIKLTNSRKTTVDDLCKFIYSDVKAYQEEREYHYLEQLKLEYGNVKGEDTSQLASEQATIIGQKIEKDTKTFSFHYAKDSIDATLDAMNEKKFKTKKGPQNLLVLLTTLQEMNE